MMWASVFFSFLSAMIWLAAAAIPKTAWIIARAGGGGPSQEIDAILRRLRLQSYLNAVPAFCAFVAVLLLAILQLK
jgi:hypothetical protein